MTEQTELSSTPPEILIVEDSPVEAELLRRSLARAGYRVTVTKNGEEALQAARAQRPGLVVSDIRMPLMNGYQLCREIKYDEALWNVPVILLTMLSEPDDIMEAINSGADSYIIKPFVEADLLERIRALLSTPISRKRAEERRTEQVEYNSKPYTITGGSQQVLNLLLSVYQNTLSQNRDLMKIQSQLNLLNDSLDNQVRERTAALAESEEKFRTIFAEARDGIVLIDDTGLIVQCNPEFQRQTGRSIDQLTQTRIWELCPPDKFELSERKFRETWANGMGEASDLTFQKPGGETVPIEFRATAITIGGKRHLQCILRDITERKRQTERTAALLELTTLAETLDERTLLQHGLDSVQHLTGSRIGFLHFVSEDQNEIELVTWSTDTLARYCQANFDHHYPVSDAGIWADCIRLKQAIIVNDYATAPGKKGFPEGHAEVQRFISVPIFEGEQVRMIVGVGNAARDYGELHVETVKLFSYDLYHIVQRKHAEQALRDSEDRYRQLFENMRSGVVVFAPDAACEVFTIESVNQAMERIEHRPREESLGRNVEEVSPVLRDLGLLAVFQRVCRSGEAEYVPAVSYQLNGISSWRDGNVYRLDSGEIVAIYDDVTERKQAELKLSEQLDELRRWNEVTQGREIRVLELKHEINELLGQAGQPPRYPSAEAAY